MRTFQEYYSGHEAWQFLQNIIANYGDSAPYMVFADYLDEDWPHTAAWIHSQVANGSDPMAGIEEVRHEMRWHGIELHQPEASVLGKNFWLDFRMHGTVPRRSVTATGCRPIRTASTSGSTPSGTAAAPTGGNRAARTLRSASAQVPPTTRSRTSGPSPSSASPPSSWPTPWKPLTFCASASGSWTLPPGNCPAPVNGTPLARVAREESKP